MNDLVWRFSAKNKKKRNPDGFSRFRFVGSGLSRLSLNLRVMDRSLNNEIFDLPGFWDDDFQHFIPQHRLEVFRLGFDAKHVVEAEGGMSWSAQRFR